MFPVWRTPFSRTGRRSTDASEIDLAEQVIDLQQHGDANECLPVELERHELTFTGM